MGVRPAALAMALLMLVPAVSASWDTTGGDAGRTAPLVLAPGPIDVLGYGDMPFNMVQLAFWGSGMLSTPDGIVASLNTHNGPGCTLAVFDDPLGPPRANYSFDSCGTPSLAAYDPAAHAAIICRFSDLSGAFLEARDVRTGAQIWKVTGDALGFPPSSQTAGCLSAALDPTTRELFVPAYSHGVGIGTRFGGVDTIVSNKLAIIDADKGALKSVTDIPSNAAIDGAPTAPVGPATDYYDEYHGVTLTSTGVVLSGYVQCPDQTFGSCNEGVVAWFTRTGVFQGKLRSASGDPSQLTPQSFTNARGISKFAAAQGPTAAFLIGLDVMLLNPDTGSAAARQPVEAISPNFVPFVTQAVWSGDTIVLGLSTSVAAVDKTLAKKWSWAKSVDDYVDDIEVTNGGQLLVTTESQQTSNVTISVLDLRTGAQVYEIPLPIAAADWDRFDYGSRISEGPDGRLLFVDDPGHRVLLGPAPAAELPAARASNDYPEPGRAISLALSPPSNGTLVGYTIFWGDGSSERVDPGANVTHVFASRGDSDVRVMARLVDGRTRTKVLTIHVGGDAPAQLTALQKAFAPENQNLTFFVLGTIVTIVGAAFTIGRHRRRLAKLERELEAVEEIRILSVEDPRGAALSLKRYRDRLPEDLARRRIDDSQYQILDQRSGRLLKVLRTRMFAPYDAHLSMRYHRLLDAAFEDAILQPSERTALVSALAEESIAPEDRAAIVAILDDFTSQRAV